MLKDHTVHKVGATVNINSLKTSPQCANVWIGNKVGPTLIKYRFPSASSFSFARGKLPFPNPPANPILSSPPPSPSIPSTRIRRLALASLSLAMAGSDRAQGMTLRAAGGLLAPGCEENEGRGPDGARQDPASLWEPPPPAAAGAGDAHLHR